MKISFTFLDMTPKIGMSIHIPDYVQTPVSSDQITELKTYYRNCLSTFAIKDWRDPKTVARALYIEGKKNATVVITGIEITFTIPDEVEIVHTFNRDELEQLSKVEF